MINPEKNSMKVTFVYSFQFKGFNLLINFSWLLYGKAWCLHVCHILNLLATKCLYAPLLWCVALHIDNLKNCVFNVKIDQGI